MGMAKLQGQARCRVVARHLPFSLLMLLFSLLHSCLSEDKLLVLPVPSQHLLLVLGSSKERYVVVGAVSQRTSGKDPAAGAREPRDFSPQAQREVSASDQGFPALPS